MRDSTLVTFTGFGEKGISFNISSIFAEFDLFSHHFTIRWYGAIIAFGFLLAVLFGGRMAYKWKMNLDKMVDVLIYGTIFGIIGARLYYCIFEWESYKDNPADILKIWNGGLAIYGGIIGGIAAAFIVCRIRKMNFYNLLDIASMSLLIGQGIGRWGNFANQEAFGSNTTMPWGMWSSKIRLTLLREYPTLIEKGMNVDPELPVHPTFLYESIWCLTGFVLLYIFTKKFRRFSGQTFLCYGMWYGLGRMIIEGFRTDSLYIGGTTVRVSQALSAAIVLVSLILFIILTGKYKKNPQPVDGVDFFLEDKLKAEQEKDDETEAKDETDVREISEDSITQGGKDEQDP